MPTQEIIPHQTRHLESTLPDLTAFRRRFTIAAERAARLSHQLKGAAQALATAGEMPSDDVMTELMAVRAEIQEVRQKIADMAASLGIAMDAAESISSLAALQPILNAIVQAEQQRYEIEATRVTALATLNRVLALTHRDVSRFPPLRDCQAQAIALTRTLTESAWKQLPPETIALARGIHPLCILLKLTEDAGGLDDELWARLLETVATSFSRPLALAAARGRLIAARSQTAVSPAAPTDPSRHDRSDALTAKDAQDDFRFERISLP